MKLQKATGNRVLCSSKHLCEGPQPRRQREHEATSYTNTFIHRAAQLPAMRHLPYFHDRHLTRTINHKSTGLLPPSPSQEPSLTDYLMRLRARLSVFRKHVPKHQGCSRNGAAREGANLQAVSTALRSSSTQRER